MVYHHFIYLGQPVVFFGNFSLSRRHTYRTDASTWITKWSLNNYMPRPGFITSIQNPESRVAANSVFCRRNYTLRKLAVKSLCHVDFK